MHSIAREQTKEKGLKTLVPQQGDPLPRWRPEGKDCKMSSTFSNVGAAPTGGPGVGAGESSRTPLTS